MSETKLPNRDSDGKLPAFAWPGGYPILYLDGSDEVLCAACATRLADDPEEFEKYKPYAFMIHEEGPTVYCENCNAPIESACGDPDAEEETK